MADCLLYRCCEPSDGEILVRAVDEEKRTARFVAATERGVPTPWGPEVLRMSGARLRRYRKNPVILDTHDRFSAGAVVGRAKVKVEGRQLIAEVEFANTARAGEVWELVRTGFLRALSVGWRPTSDKKIRRLADGEVDGEGPDAIRGPAVVVREWELAEISVVPVPADEDALRRELYGGVAVADVTTKSEERAVETAATASTDLTGLIDEENKTRAMKARREYEIARREAILAIAPTALRGAAEDCVMRGLSVDEAREELLKLHKERGQSLGTPEPETEKQHQRHADGFGDLASIPDHVLIRSF